MLCKCCVFIVAPKIADSYIQAIRTILLEVQLVPAEHQWVKKHASPQGLYIPFYGQPSQLLREKLFVIIEQLKVDIFLQPHPQKLHKTRLMIFDMDSTLIQQEVIDELGVEAGVGDKMKKITHLAMSGQLDFSESLRKRVALLKNLSADVFEKVAQRIELSPGVRNLIHFTKEHAITTAIVSGGFDFFAERIKKTLEIDFSFANALVIKDRKISGELKGEIIDARRKATIVTELAGKIGVKNEEMVVVGDGANDLPMLELGQLGIAYRPSPQVRARAPQAICNHPLDIIPLLLGYGDATFF